MSGVLDALLDARLAEAYDPTPAAREGSLIGEMHAPLEEGVASRARAYLTQPRDPGGEGGGQWVKGGGAGGSSPVKVSRLPSQVRRETRVGRTHLARAPGTDPHATRSTLHTKKKLSEEELPAAVGDGSWSMRAASAAEALKKGVSEDTEAIHRDRNPDGSLGHYRRERIDLHNRIIGLLLQGAGFHPEDATAAFLAGGPASGKSSLERAGLVKVPKDAVLVNPDVIKAMLPEYRDLVGAKIPTASSKVHEESSFIAKKLMQLAVARKHHVVLDAVGDSKSKVFASKVEAARKTHRTKLVYATIPTDEAVARSARRGERTGRKVPEGYLRAAHRDVSRRFVEDILPALFPFEVYDNTTKKPKLVASRGEGGDVIVHDRKLYEAFLGKAKS